MAYNLDAQGNPIPSWIPTGATITSVKPGAISYLRPGENAATSSPITVNAGGGMDYTQIMADLLKQKASGVQAGGTTGADTSSIVTKQSDVDKGAFVGPGGNILYTGKKEEPKQFFARNAQGNLTEGLGGLTAEQRVSASAEKRQNAMQADEKLTSDTPQGGGRSVSMTQGGQNVTQDGQTTFQQDPNYNPQQAVNTPGTNIPEFVNMDGAYFRQTVDGLAAVNDPKVLDGLRKGSIQSTKSTEMPTDARSFASVLSSNAGASLTPQNVATYTSTAQKFGLPPPEVGQSQFLNDPISFISQMTAQINKAMGFDQATSEINKIANDYEKLQNKKDQEIRDINDDPWLTEGVRLRQIQKVEEKYRDQEGNMTEKLQLLQNVKKDAQQQAQFALGTAVSLFDSERRYQAQQVQAYYDQAQQQFENEIALQELALKSMPEAIKPTSEMQEYMLSVEQGFNGGFLDYKMAVAAAGRAPSSGTGISNAMIDNERALFSQFRGEPIVKDYNTVLSQKLTVDNILNGKLGGPGDLAIVYEFMKGLDPTSVVRETEYDNAAKSGNIFAGAFAKYNGYLKPNGGFLPEGVKQSFKSIVDGKLNVKTQLYNNLTNEYRGLAQRQGLNPDNVAIGYNNAATAPAPINMSVYTPPESTYDNVKADTPASGGVFSNFVQGLASVFSR